MRCEFVFNDSSTKCSRPVIATIHDRRGCRDLCLHHTMSRLQQSFMLPTDENPCQCERDKTVPA